MDEIRRVPPYRALKPYRCPGCDHLIMPGVGHWVVIPEHAPDLRRHWHLGCWHKEEKRTTHGRAG